MQSGEDAEGDAHASSLIADAECFGSRCSVVLPCAMGPTGDAVVTGGGIAVLRIRAPLAVTARAGVDQPRVQSLDRVVVQTEPLHYAFLIVFDEHVGAGDELAREFDAFL